MPPEAPRAGSPQDWLRRAKSNLARARQSKPAEVLWEDLCFDSQQAAEKAVKAVLALHGADFPRTHELARLFDLLESSAHPVSDELWNAASVLTPYAIETRYPGVGRPLTQADHREALALACKVVQWAEGELSTAK